jgi:AcrR family transcriptional regulator
MTPTLQLDLSTFALDDPVRDLHITAVEPAADSGHQGSRVVSLTQARRRRDICDAARELLAVADYAAVDFDAVAQAAGVRPADVRRHFGSRIELTMAALTLPPPLTGALRARLTGAQTVARFLAFWEDGANTAILLNVFRATLHDRRVVREVQACMERVLVRPLVGGLATPDAAPRARLVTSALVGLAVTRYVLREEPLASADHATVAAWMGPAIDCYLRDRLGA